jgi:starch phosphorylase
MKLTFPYDPEPPYQKPIAYFSMEFAIDQALKIYSGGLGFLAGSHMRSAYDLQQNMVGIGILWKYGYYDQTRNADNTMGVLFQEKYYNFLRDTGITLEVPVHANRVKVKVHYLDPEIFGTAPIFLLSTFDHPDNDYLSKSITERLYANNLATRIAQYIVLGVGGMKLLERINHHVDVYHFNEAHALPGAFYLYGELKDPEKLKKRLVFTTHTPVGSGNDVNPYQLLNDMSFFNGCSYEEVENLVGKLEGGMLNHTLAALRLCKGANAVSQKHKEVANDMWKDFKDVPEITGITNAQNGLYWTDKVLEESRQASNRQAYQSRKKELKKALFDIVADQCGKIFDPDVLTVVWARRFADYKRVDLITRNQEEFQQLLNHPDYPIQIIWAGKPYPLDHGSVAVFNHLVHFTRPLDQVAVLTGYELGLSAALKKGSDVWLNNPRIPLEASGTSGMTASMNGSVNVSTRDGWILEFARDEENGFYVPFPDEKLSAWDVDEHDRKHLLQILREKVLPMYYQRPEAWTDICWQATEDVFGQFDAGRMAHEYYERLYSI